MATPIFTACTILSMFICPGTISLYELTIPTNGFSNSSSVNPNALNRDLCGAVAIPFFTASLFISIFPFYKDSSVNTTTVYFYNSLVKFQTAVVSSFFCNLYFYLTLKYARRSNLPSALFLPADCLQT